MGPSSREVKVDAPAVLFRVKVWSTPPVECSEVYNVVYRSDTMLGGPRMNLGAIGLN